MHNFKNSLIFCGIVVLIGLLLSFTMLPSSGFRVILHEVQEPDVNYDLIIVGQSHGETDIDPLILEEKTGLTSYNMSRRLLSMQDLYYLVKESNYKNKSQVIVMDIDSTYWVGDGFTNYFNDSYIYHHLNNPLNKLEYFFKYALENDYRVTLSSYIDVKTGLANLVSTVKNKLSSEYRMYSMKAVEMPSDNFIYKGRGFRYAVKRTGTPYETEMFDEEKVNQKAIDSFVRIVEYCEKNDIELICVSSPLPKSRTKMENYEAVYEYFSKLAFQYDVPYFDFNHDTLGDLQWSEEEFMDGDGHMMGYFAEEYSKVLGELIAEHRYSSL